MPQIRPLLNAIFGCEMTYSDEMDPAEVVAEGATYMANILT